MELRLNCEVLKADGMGLDGIGESKVEEEIRIECDRIGPLILWKYNEIYGNQMK